MSTERIV